MRGKEVPENTYQLKHRITPAYAGKRFCVRWNIGNFRDHPRVCGEKMYGLLGASFALGSPPRMRGKGRVLPVFDSLTGITPAYAGKSVYFAIFCDFVEDHPRVCGEKQNAPIMQGLNLGSPPRMRGKVLFQRRTAHVQGITPAYAGKSVPRLQVLRKNQDHPRVCGEKGTFLAKPNGKLGSPPRMRGKESANARTRHRARITPAYAGKRYGVDFRSTTC